MKKLVDGKWLNAHANNPNLVILDARPTEEFQVSHIKNAVSTSFDPEHLSHGMSTSYGGGIDLFTDHNSSIPFQDGPPEQIRDVVRSWGINNDSEVIIYDSGASFLATRVYWTLTHHGKKNAHILNGGIEKCLIERHKLTSEVVTLPNGDFEPRIIDKATAVETDYVLANLTNSQVTIVDATLQSWFHGSLLNYSKRGHIPNAINIPYPLCFREDKTWKPIKELKEIFEALGLYPNKEIVIYCGGSPAASLLYFTIKQILHYPRVKYYLGSLVTWLSDPRNLPLFTYGNDNMLRDSEWVRWFTGRRIHGLVRNTKVLAVDVRPQSDYEAGHIPFSINLPVKELLSSANQKRKSWQNLLEQKNINSEIEIVIYDERHNIASSILFWILEAIGHHKISFLNGGFRDWTDHDFEVSMEEAPFVNLHIKKLARARNTTFASPKEPRRKENYLLEKRFFAKEKSSAVWLGFSNENTRTPAADASQTSKYIFLKDCANESGFFKIAGDLSTLFENAHIYKYQQIVCRCEDFAQSTYLYVLLRLMGFRNLQVFVPDKLLKNTLLSRLFVS